MLIEFNLISIAVQSSAPFEYDAYALTGMSDDNTA
jgi:hypothetical protein